MIGFDYACVKQQTNVSSTCLGNFCEYPDRSDYTVYLVAVCVCSFHCHDMSSVLELQQILSNNSAHILILFS